jgi:hypothetical protein
MDMWRSVLLGVVLAGVLAGCSLGGKSADDFPPHESFATVSYPVGVLPTATGECAFGPMCLPHATYNCPAMADTCFTAKVAEHPGVTAEMVSYEILCHGVGRPKPNPPGTCQAINELVGLEAENDPSVCNGGLGSGVLPAGRVVGRVNGKYVSESITDLLCGLGSDGARAAHDRHVLMPQLFRSG